jgi:hypothetical protein
MGMTMRGHLSEETLLDVAEGQGGPADREHARECAGCAARVADARDGLVALATEDGPEPPPFYFEQLRREVGARLDPPPRRAFSGWLLPLAAAAGLFVVVPLTLREPKPLPLPSTAPALPAWSALPPAEEDVDLAVLEAVAFAEPEAAVAALERPVSLDEELLDLSEEDNQALARAIRARPGGLL